MYHMHILKLKMEGGKGIRKAINEVNMIKAYCIFVQKCPNETFHLVTTH
jgi:hypothetical protein